MPSPPTAFEACLQKVSEDESLKAGPIDADAGFQREPLSADVGAHVQVIQRSHLSRRSTEEGVNMRDVAGCFGGGYVSPTSLALKPGRVYRCSQVHSRRQLQKIQIKAVVDLRELGHECKRAEKEANRSVLTTLAVPITAPIAALPERAKLPMHRAHQAGCPICSEAFREKNKVDVVVYHVDLLPVRMKMQLFFDMPWSVRWRTLTAPFMGKCPAEVMAPAVADPELMGYPAFYRMMLDLSQQPIAKALRLFADPENLPALVHCIHGKDRTGLIVALLLLLVGVNEETVVLDYVKSEVSLKTARNKGALPLEAYLVGDGVIASTRETMEATLEHLNTKYGGIRSYARIIGLTKKEVKAIRSNMCDKAEEEVDTPPDSPRSPQNDLDKVSEF